MCPDADLIKWKVLFSTRCIGDFMCILNKKYWTVSNQCVISGSHICHIVVEFVCNHSQQLEIRRSWNLSGFIFGICSVPFELMNPFIGLRNISFWSIDYISLNIFLYSFSQAYRNRYNIINCEYKNNSCNFVALDEFLKQKLALDDKN